MKILLVAVLGILPALSFAEQPTVFDLSDLGPKINSGMSADTYCAEKAAESVRQAKAMDAPPEVQSALAKWVGIACNLDIIEEKKRIKHTP